MNTPSPMHDNTATAAAADVSVGPLCLAGGVLLAALTVIAMAHNEFVALIAGLAGMAAAAVLLRIFRRARRAAR